MLSFKHIVLVFIEQGVAWDVGNGDLGVTVVEATTSSELAVPGCQQIDTVRGTILEGT